MVNNRKELMSTENNFSCVVCGSTDAFVFSDYSLKGKKRGRCNACGANWDA